MRDDVGLAHIPSIPPSMLQQKEKNFKTLSVLAKHLSKKFQVRSNFVFVISIFQTQFCKAREEQLPARPIIIGLPYVPPPKKKYFKTDEGTTSFSEKEAPR